MLQQTIYSADDKACYLHFCAQGDALLWNLLSGVLGMCQADQQTDYNSQENGVGPARSHDAVNDEWGSNVAINVPAA